MGKFINGERTENEQKTKSSMLVESQIFGDGEGRRVRIQKKKQKRSFGQNSQVTEVKGGRHFRRSSVVNTVEENEDGENATGLGKVIIETRFKRGDDESHI